MAATKTCTKCKKIKFLSEFWKSKAGKDGLFTQCKSCLNIVNTKATKKYREKTPWKPRVSHYNKRYGGKLKEKDLIEIFKKQGNCCALCGIELDDSWGTGDINLDHIIPRCLGGKTILSNLQFLCRKCNIGKYTGTPAEYIAHCERVVLFNRKEN